MEQELETAIGVRIRRLRTDRNLKLDDLATASGVSRAMISRIERGEASPTAALLARVCAALGLSLSAFFAEEGEAAPLLRRQDQQVWRDPETGYVRRAVSPPRTSSDVDIVDVEFPAGARVSFPPHAAASGMTQHIWMFDGEMEMTTGDNTVHRLLPGDCLFMPVAEGHVFHNPGPAPARYCVVLDRRRH
ncbi:helix-turn-helix domain-containing protein [Rhizobium sp. 16-449-1b]|uniref:helix-turn-helix domain-containing protein n=1 Tax=Rhizobium sp. 16-449-1b TaxID=2819989 RepID=UPI001ADBA4B3|nr:helix-turn-helix domain-containing protein [Rhizobium sp. 16-449-1b]MBO9192489.1 helix-turn-helix domain-containing protein [Rhizobium sp. 16-449-1b]